MATRNRPSRARKQTAAPATVTPITEAPAPEVTETPEVTPEATTAEVEAETALSPIGTKGPRPETAARRASVMEFVKANPGATLNQVAEGVGEPVNKVYNDLLHFTDAGELKATRPAERGQWTYDVAS